MRNFEEEMEERSPSVLEILPFSAECDYCRDKAITMVEVREGTDFRLCNNHTIRFFIVYDKHKEKANDNKTNK